MCGKRLWNNFEREINVAYIPLEKDFIFSNNGMVGDEQRLCSVKQRKCSAIVSFTIFSLFMELDVGEILILPLITRKWRLEALNMVMFFRTMPSPNCSAQSISLVETLRSL